MTEREFNAAFEKARPRILGALLDAASHGLPPCQSCVWITCRAWRTRLMGTCLRGRWWQPGKIIDAYMGCADDAVDAVSKRSALVALRAFIAKQGFFMSDDGDQTEFRYWKALAKRCSTHFPALHRKGHSEQAMPWPADATRLSGRLSMAGPALKQRGVTVEKGRENSSNRTRWIEIKALDTADDERGSRLRLFKPPPPRTTPPRSGLAAVFFFQAFIPRLARDRVSVGEADHGRKKKKAFFFLQQGKDSVPSVPPPHLAPFFLCAAMA